MNATMEKLRALLEEAGPTISKAKVAKAKPADEAWAPRVASYQELQAAEEQAKAILASHPAFQALQAAQKAREELRDMFKTELKARGGETAQIATSKGVVTLKITAIPATFRHLVKVGPPVAK